MSDGVLFYIPRALDMKHFFVFNITWPSLESVSIWRDKSLILKFNPVHVFLSQILRSISSKNSSYLAFTLAKLTRLNRGHLCLSDSYFTSILTRAIGLASCGVVNKQCDYFKENVKLKTEKSEKLYFVSLGNVQLNWLLTYFLRYVLKLQ